MLTQSLHVKRRPKNSLPRKRHKAKPYWLPSEVLDAKDTPDDIYLDAVLDKAGVTRHILPRTQDLLQGKQHRAAKKALRILDQCVQSQRDQVLESEHGSTVHLGSVRMCDAEEREGNGRAPQASVHGVHRRQSSDVLGPSSSTTVRSAHSKLSTGS